MAPRQRSQTSIHHHCYIDNYPETQYPKGTPRRCRGQDAECASLVFCSTCRKCHDETCFRQNSSGFFEARACIDCDNRKKKAKMKKASKGEDPADQASSSHASSSQAFPNQDALNQDSLNQDSLNQPSQLVRPIHPPTQQQLSSLHASNPHQQAFGHLQPNFGSVYNHQSLGLPQTPTGRHQSASGPYQQFSGPPLAYFPGYG
ncbi:hypothetical protein Landi51_07863 [Colletotrichum acutatum]